MQARKLLFLMFFILLAILGARHNALAASTNFKVSDNGSSKTRVLASFYKKPDGKAGLIIATHFEMEEGWKLYGPLEDSGFSFGQPPVFNFEGSQNIIFNNHKIIWPEAIRESEKIGNQVVNYLVYKNQVVIPVDLSVSDLSRVSSLSLKVDYGVCKEVCIPVSQTFDLEIPSGEVDQQSLDLIQQYLGENLILKPLSLLTQVPSPDAQGRTLLSVLLIAFIGGLILNIMPCVLPVLSIKLINIIAHSGSSLRRIRFGYLATILGIVFCFAVLASFTSLLKLAGNSLGWGLQFQNPYFLIFLIAVLVVFIANLLGSFEISSGNFLGSALNKEISEQEGQERIFLPNFLSGILAVLLATPCSAPFLGTAISFALSQGVIKIFIVFLMMSFGLAFPYFVLIVFPKISNLLPKPGAWMLRVKNLMAGFLAATIMWLTYVLIDNIGFIAGMMTAFLSALLLFFFARVFPKPNLKSWLKLLIFIGLVFAIFILPIKLAKNFATKEREYNQIWVKFDQTKIGQLVKEGKTVVVDITADWCITCKANKILVLDTDEVVLQLKNPNVVAMRGDLTIPNEEIMNFLRSHNRYGIPFNIIYGPGTPNGVLVSELLNKDQFLNLIAQASKQ